MKEQDELLLRKSLALAVPLWIEELQRKRLSYLMKRKEECAKIIAEKGDVILYKSKTRGRSGEAFNALAEGVAILALIAKGGVQMFGLHFDAQHPEIENGDKGVKP